MALQASFPMLHSACIPRCSRITHILAALASKHRAHLQPRRHQSTTSYALPPNLHPQSAPSNPLPPPPSSRDKRALYVASLFGFSLALYLSFIYVGIRRDLSSPKALAQDSDVWDRWDAVGRNYDDEIELAEKAMFMGRKRRRLVSQARGEVLEVSVGTGRNMQFYDLDLWGKTGEKEHDEGRVTGLVFNDKAGVMVEKARKKFEELEGGKMPAQRFRGRVEFVVGDAGEKGAIRGPSGGFDTIVQTMGLCSTSDPVGLLKRLGELCKKPALSRKGKADERGGEKKVEYQVVEGKYGREIIKQKEEEYDGGRILLLEHGRGFYNWLNKVLDGLAPGHADHYGCWYNRNIGAIVEQSGLEVESIRRYHLGTTWEVVLKPKREEEVAIAVAAESDIQEDKRSGWVGWMAKGVAEAISWR